MMGWDCYNLHDLLTYFTLGCCVCAAASKNPDHTAVSVPMFKGGADDRQILGDATDCGLLRYCDKLAPSSLVRMAYKKVSAFFCAVAIF